MNNQKPKKEVSNGYLAIIHFLTAGFAIPFFFVTLTSVIINFLFHMFGKEVFVSLIVLVLYIIASITAIIVGVMESYNLIKKRYIVKNIRSLVKNSTIIFVIVRIFGVVLNISVGNTIIWSSSFIFDIIVLIVCAIIFYKYTEKYFGKYTATN